MGLGPVHAVGLADARRLAGEARAIIAGGADPLAARRAEENKTKEKPTFGEFADQLIEQIEGGFRNDKHKAQWKMTLGPAYCRSIRSKKIDEIDTADVLRILKPIWLKKAETASRLRGRIERVLDAAAAQGLRGSDNPARWKGGLQPLLPARSKIGRSHHAAMPFAELPTLVARLRSTGGISAHALEFTILTAARSGEVLGARWDEIDMDAAIWTVPASRMKAGKSHRVAMPDRALEILSEMALLRPAGDDQGQVFVFPGRKAGKGLSVMALTMALRRLDLGSYTVHGFRSAFRDWAGEITHYPREIAESALAHAVGNQVELAYRRGDALEKRRSMMQDWADFCGGRHAGGNVIPLPRKG